MKSRRAAVIFIIVTVTLDILAMGLIIPVLPRIILIFLGGKVTSAADWQGWFALVFALMQFFFSPVLGVLSDRFGRRPIILLSNLGLGLDYIVMALAPNLAWLFLGRVISGITTSSIPTAMAYISDVVPREKRAGAFGMIGVAFGLGFTIGPALGGFLSDREPRLAFWVAAAFSLANWLWGYFFVPESLPLEKRKKVELRRANPARLTCAAPFAPGFMAAFDHSIPCLRGEQRLFGLDALLYLPVQLESALDRVFPHGRWGLRCHHLRRTDRPHGEVGR